MKIPRLAAVAASMEQRILRMVEVSLQRQKKRLGKAEHTAPTRDELVEIIENAARKSAGIAAGFSLIPGPLGMIALAKELQEILQAQIDLIAHLTLRLHERERVTPELILAMLETAAGNVGITLLTTQGGKILLRRLSRQAAEHLGKRLLQKGGYHLLAKWLPLAGSGLMYYHTFHSTKRLGERTMLLLHHGILIDDAGTLADDGETA